MLGMLIKWALRAKVWKISIGGEKILTLRIYPVDWQVSTAIEKLCTLTILAITIFLITAPSVIALTGGREPADYVWRIHPVIVDTESRIVTDDRGRTFRYADDALPEVGISTLVRCRNDVSYSEDGITLHTTYSDCR